MPALSMFFGIFIYMYNEKDGKHNMPHIHAEYGEYEAAFDFNGKKIEGKFPRNQKRKVQVWIDIHKKELQANWKILSEGGEFFRIPPLQ